MGTLYAIQNDERREAIFLNVKYGEIINHAQFIAWLSLEWNEENWQWVTDKNGGGYPADTYDYDDQTESYMSDFEDCFWFHNKEKKKVRE